MPKSGRGRGSSSAASKHPRSSSTGRVQKSGKQTFTNPAAITKTSDGIDLNLLHADYRPPVPRSPVFTRGRAAASGSGQGNGPKPSGSKLSGGVPTSNTYDSLSGEDDDDVEINSDDDDNGPACSTKEKNKTRPKERRPPPIHCLDHLADDIDELLEGHEYCLKLGKASVQVITLNKKSFADVTMVLKTNRIKYYTFDHAENVPVEIVLQGYKDRPISELGRSFASVVASGSGNSGQQEVTGEDLFTLPEFFALAGEMMTRFRACRNKAEQFMALGELMIKHIYNR